MRHRWLFLFLGIFIFVLSACGINNNSPVTPASDRLTFLFFYIDG